MTKVKKNLALSLQNLSMSYGALNVLSDVSLDVKRGEIFGLIGLNGAGKTTLIKAVLSLRNRDSGDILILDKPAQEKDARKSLVFLPERFEPPWFLTGIEFIKFSLRIYGHPFSEKLAYEMAEKLALDPKALKRKVQTFSKGMRQKLGLIATFMTQCELLILDEPMSGLDPRARSLVKSLMDDCQKENKRTIFLSSHILADMDEICDRVCVLHNSQIIYTGTPQKMKSSSNSNSLEQSFLNLIEGKSTA